MRLTRTSCANYIQKFIKWTVYDNSGYTVRKPLSKPREVRVNHWFFGHHKPWTSKGITAGKKGGNILVEPVAEKDKKIFLGDKVEVLTGADKGKMGIVTKIFDETNLCIVGGLNTKSAENSGEEKPLLVTSEVQLIDPAEQTKTEIEWRYTKDGERVRVSLKSGRIIPFSPTYLNTTYDGIDKTTYKASSKDTADDHYKEVTYVPKLSTFEQDIMDEMGIVDTRVYQKKYWY